MKKGYAKLVLIILVGAIVFSNGNILAQAEEYEYDELDRVIKVTYEGGSYVEYLYDANGNILDVTVVNNVSEPTESTEPSESIEPSESTEPTESTEPSESTENPDKPDQPEEQNGIVKVLSDIGNAIVSGFKKIISWFENLFH